MSNGQPLVETVTLKQAKALIKALAHEQSILMLSPPGVGKSDTVLQAAREAGLPCRSLLGTQIAPEDVDALFERLMAAGHQGLRHPWDAFWGQRYASLLDPDGNGVDLYATLPASS